MNRRVFVSLRIAVVVALFSALSASAATVSKLNDDVFAPMRDRAGAMRKIVLDKVPLYEGSRSVIELEEFQVWAADGKVIIHGEGGKVTTMAPPSMRFFRGSVNGDPESFAYFSLDPSNNDIQGLVVTRDKKMSVASQRPPASRLKKGELQPALADVFLTEFTDADSAELTQEGQWACDVDKIHPSTPGSRLHATGARGLPLTENAITGTQSYAIKLDILTDFELYQNAGSNSTTLTNYITNMTGAVSTIYNRDLHTNVTQGNLSIYTAVGDPWNAATTSGGLIEVGDYVHANPTTASNTVFMSGKNIPGGVAWEAVACGGEFLCSGGNCGSAAFDGHYGGPYAWCGLIGNGGLGTVPDPNSTQNGTLYGMSSGTQNYWPLAEYAHELGHNMAGHHTHCVAITAGEFPAAGFTDGTVEGAGTDFVDHCYGSEGLAGCVSQSNYLAGSQGTFKGTIMSYCHNVFIGGVPQSRFVFGPGAEPSHHEVDDYMYNPAGPIGGGLNIRNGVGAFTIGAITAPASVSANATGQAASIAAIGGATYSWQISNGTITSSTTSNAITFTAGATGTVGLRVTAYGANHCGVTDTKNVTINSVPCTYVISPTQRTFSAAGGSGTINLTTACIWTAGNNTPSFLTLTGLTSGTGNAAITFSVAPNLTGVSRSGSITAGGQLFTINQSTGAADSASQDLDSDGKSDLIWRNSATGQSSIWFMNGPVPTGASGLTSLQFSNATYGLGGVGDFNGDGKADLVWRNNTTGDTILWAMNGATVTNASGNFNTVPAPWQIAGVGDFNGDGNSDIMWRNMSDGQDSIWLLNGTSIIGGASLPQISDLNYHVAGIGDFNKDGKSDILWRNDVTGISAIWFMNGTALTGSSGATALQIGSTFRVAGVGDLNGDGFTDIVWRSTTTGDNILWLMNGINLIAGSGTMLQIADQNFSIAAVGDFDGNGKDDLIWRNSVSGVVSVWFMSGVAIQPGSQTVAQIAPPWGVVGPKF
jgi:hypothetical protein